MLIQQAAMRATSESKRVMEKEYWMALSLVEAARWSGLSCRREDESRISPMVSRSTTIGGWPEVARQIVRPLSPLSLHMFGEGEGRGEASG